MRCFASLLLLAPLAFLSACSSFDQKWFGTSMPVTANPAALMAGKWEGSWQSDSTSYVGNLKAVIVPAATVAADNSTAQQYRADIKMTLYDFFSNEHGVILKAKPGTDGRLHFVGQVDRGTPFGGIYVYDGYVENDYFFCDYVSDRDCGTLKMHRLTLNNQPLQ